MNKHEVQQMIDDAMKKHSIQSTIISAALGSILLAFYAHGVITLVN